MRIEKNKWSLASDDPALEEFFGMAPRNAPLARIRLTIKRYRGRMGAESAPKDAAGNLVNEPSDDELLPLVPAELLLPQRPSLKLGPKWSSFPNPITSERDAKAPPPTEPGPEVPRVDGRPYLQGDLDFSQR